MPQPLSIQTSEVEQLIAATERARKHAYAPYSRFQVGAALLVDGGEIFAGGNIENASYSLTICAERVAASAAVAAGSKSWRAIAIASPGGVTPCGACRQFLSEFEADLAVITVDVEEGTRRILKLRDLLPMAFDDTNLPT